MKKIAFALIAVSTLGLAACGGNEAANSSNTSSATTNEALGDLSSANSAESETLNALDAQGNVMANETSANTSAAAGEMGNTATTTGNSAANGM